jgi:hypothetical protein
MICRPRLQILGKQGFRLAEVGGRYDQSIPEAVFCAEKKEAALRPPPARKRRDQSSYITLPNSSTSDGWVLGIG